VADYKAKKLVTSELLANADLDGIDASSDEGEANAYMDRMIEEYSKAGGGTGAQTRSNRPPPAVL